MSYHLAKGEPLGVVGESGCGKSVTALSILRLIPVPPGKIVGGEIFFKGKNLLDLHRGRDEKDSWKSDLDDLPGADDLPQSGLYGRKSDSGNHPITSRPIQERCPRKEHRDAETGQYSLP